MQNVIYKHFTCMITEEFACGKDTYLRDFDIKTIGKKNPFEVTQIDPAEKDVTDVVVGKKGLSTLGPSKLVIKLKPARPTNLLVRLKVDSAQSVDFKANNMVTQVCGNVIF